MVDNKIKCFLLCSTFKNDYIIKNKETDHGFTFFLVGQVKFDPPLRKETEPHHELVSKVVLKR